MNPGIKRGGASSVEEKVRKHCIFYGKVQGVFFRAHTKQFAEENHVMGWVRNLPDGTVEGVFEGRKKDVEAVIRLCKEAQPYAQVTQVDVREEPYKGEETSFRVLPTPHQW